MSELDVINDRLQKGDERFAEVTEALSRITTHLQSQDETMAELARKMDKGLEGTESIVEMWNGGVTTVRFFCRLAEAWKFMLRQVVGPVVVPVLLIYALIYYTNHGQMPAWIGDAYRLLRLI